MQYIFLILVILLDKGPESGQIRRRWIVGVLPKKGIFVGLITTDCKNNTIY
jgi:hypothetical protein